MPPSARSRKVTAERRVRCLRLRAAGVSFEQIAAELGYASRHAASVDARRALAEQAAETAPGDLSGLEAERIDALERAAQRIMREALDTRDRFTALAAMDRLLRISAARRALLGLDTSGHGTGRHGRHVTA